MPIHFDAKFMTDKKVSQISGKMFNKFQRTYFCQFSEEQIKKYYDALDRGVIGDYPENIPEHLL